MFIHQKDINNVDVLLGRGPSNYNHHGSVDFQERAKGAAEMIGAAAKDQDQEKLQICLHGALLVQSSLNRGGVCYKNVIR